jgi:hypothetical protein
MEDTRMKYPPMPHLSSKEQNRLHRLEASLSLPLWKYFSLTTFLCAGALNAPLVLLKISGIYSGRIHWSLIVVLLAAGFGFAFLLRKHDLKSREQLIKKAGRASEETAP